MGYGGVNTDGSDDCKVIGSASIYNQTVPYGWESQPVANMKIDIPAGTLRDDDLLVVELQGYPQFSYDMMHLGLRDGAGNRICGADIMQNSVRWELFDCHCFSGRAVLTKRAGETLIRVGLSGGGMDVSNGYPQRAIAMVLLESGFWSGDFSIQPETFYEYPGSAKLDAVMTLYRLRKNT